MIKKITLLLFITVSFLKVNSQTWNDVGGMHPPVTDGAITAFYIWNNKLVVGGGLILDEWEKPVGLGVWDGLNWDTLNFGTHGVVYSISEYNGELYAGGSFWCAGLVVFPPCAVQTSTHYIARYNGQQWYAVKEGEEPDRDVMAMKYKNQLIIGGAFYKIGTTVMGEISSWDGQNWSAIGGGVSGDPWGVSAMVEYNGDLIIGGGFYKAGGDTATGVARWDGSQWHDMNVGLHGNVEALVVDTINNILYAGGIFSSTGSVYNPQPTLCNIAQWDAVNEKWVAVGNECGSIFWNGIRTLCMYHGELFAGGYSITGTEEDTLIAKWNGWEWKKVQGPNETINKLIVYNDELYVGGYFNTINGDSIHGIARYYAPPDTTLSINEFLIKDNKCVNIYPNPSTSEITVNGYSPACLKLCDAVGQTVAESTSNKLYVGNLSQGLYVLQLFDANGQQVKTEKVIVAK